MNIRNFGEVNSRTTKRRGVDCRRARGFYVVPSGPPRLLDTPPQGTYIGAFSSFGGSTTMRVTIAGVLLILCVQTLFGQIKPDTSPQVREEDGGSVAVRTANGFLNQDSSLKRRWVVLDDPNSPAALNHAGVYPRYDEKEGMQYLMPVGIVSPKEAISAIEVRYVLFDIWGQRLRTLALTRLIDSSTHIDLRSNSNWPALESEAEQLVTTVAFVARVRTADGDVWTFDPGRIVQPMKTLGLKIAAADLAPDEQRMITPGVIYWTYSAKGDSGVKAAGVVRP